MPVPVHPQMHHHSPGEKARTEAQILPEGSFWTQQNYRPTADQATLFLGLCEEHT